MRKKTIAVLIGVMAGTAYNLADMHVTFLLRGLIRDILHATLNGPISESMHYCIHVVHYAFASLVAVLSYMIARRLLIGHDRRLRSADVPLCPKCGYALYGDVSRCPECGWQAAQSASTSDST